MDPTIAAAIAQYLASNCSGTITLSCGQNGGPGAPARCPPELDRCSCKPYAHEDDCAVSCPAPDYSDPDQPYFWDHTTMR